MKKLLSVLAVATFSANVAASSNLDQVKLNIVTKIYQPNHDHTYWLSDVDEYLTNDFKKAIAKVQKRDSQRSDDEEYSCISEVGGIYGPSGWGEDIDPSKPKIKMVGKNVQATFYQWKSDKSRKKALTYVFECKNSQCLVSDVINNKVSAKKFLANCK